MEKSGHEQLTTANGNSNLGTRPSQSSDDRVTADGSSLSVRDVCDLTATQRDVLSVVAMLSNLTEEAAPPLGCDIYDRFTAIRAESSEINRSYTYQTLRWLENNGLVESCTSESDGRANEYHPTSRGMSVLDALAARYGRVASEQPDVADTSTTVPPVSMDRAGDNANHGNGNGNTDPTVRSDGGSVTPSSAPLVRSTRARGVAKSLRNYLMTAATETITVSTAATAVDTTEHLCHEAIDARSEWFNTDDAESESGVAKTITLSDSGIEAATADPYFDPEA